MRFFLGLCLPEGCADEDDLKPIIDYMKEAGQEFGFEFEVRLDDPEKKNAEIQVMSTGSYIFIFLLVAIGMIGILGMAVEQT